MISVSALNLVKKFETSITFFIKKYYRIFFSFDWLCSWVYKFGFSQYLITVFSSNYSKNKHSIRKAIAVSYLYFGSIQLLLIIFLGKFFFQIEYLSICFFIPILFFLSNKYFQKANIENYRKNLN